MANENQPETPTPAAPAVPAEAAPPEPNIPVPSGPDAAQSVPMTAEDEEAPAWIGAADWVLVALVVALAFLMASVPAYNSDIWMQLAGGRLIAHGEYLPGGADPFSCATEAGQGREAVLWVNHSWLYGLLLYGLYSLAGGVGVIVAKGLLVGGLVVVLVRTRLANTNLLIVAICLALAVLALGTRVIFTQPVLVSWLFLGLTLLVLTRAGAFDPAGVPPADERRLRLLWALPVLSVLWVNLDDWFVLGPITVGLCWLGLAVQRWLGLGSAVPLGRLGMVFGAGVLACLLSPFHVRGIQLPPELAYLVLRGANLVGLPLPDALVGGGRMLATLHEFEPLGLVTASPLAPGYLNNPNVGYNVSGLAVFPLLALGVLSFVVNGIVGRKPGGPAPQAARFVVWLAFAGLAVALYRLVPFFAIVAAPLTAMNLGDLVAWYVRPGEAGTAPTPWIAPVRMARLLGAPLLVALLLLAWPGWLNGPFDLNSRRHVAWDVPADPSLRLAAEQLVALHQQQRGREQPLHVLNTGIDFTNYSAWFGHAGGSYRPVVKGFFDGRFSLYAAVGRDYATAKQALMDKSRPASAWSAVLTRYGIDQVAVENFLSTNAFLGWWAEPQRWRQRYADKTIGVFSWSGTGRPWPGDATVADWNARAFGVVAAADRPPPQGPPPPAEPPGLLDRYLYPATPLPREAREMDVKLIYGQFAVSQATSLAQGVMPQRLYALAGLPGAPGAAVNPFALALAVQWVKAPYDRPLPLIYPADRELPAAVVLMTRLAWQAVAEAPDNEATYLYLSNTYKAVLRLEDYWNETARRSPSPLRDSLRRTQIICALRTAADAGIAEPQVEFQAHKQLADLYRERHALDLMLEQLTLAEQVHETLKPTDPKLRSSHHEEHKNLKGFRDRLEAEVSQRRKDFDLKAASLKPLDKVRMSLYGRYSRFNRENKEEVDPNGWGLPAMTLQLLEAVDPKTLSRAEQIEWVRTTIDLLFQVGNARQASEILQRWRDALGPLGLRFDVLRAGTEGNYTDLAKTLASWEAMLAREALQSFRMAHSVGLMAPPAALGQSYTMITLAAVRDPSANWVLMVQSWGLASSEYFNMKTLRGIIALEAGDTATARRLFDEVLRETEGGAAMNYADRPIAERYAELLRQYQPK